MIRQILKKIFGTEKISGGYKQAPLKFQLGILGLDQKKIRSLEGKKVLDIGCGNGTLVKHLRSQGVEAEGIDEHAPKENYFIRQRIKGIHSMHDAIPRKDSTYDMIIAFQNSALNIAFTDTRESWLDIYRNEAESEEELQKFLGEVCQEGQYILTETGRILKPQASATIYPAITRANNIMRMVLQKDDLKFSHQNLNNKMAKSYMRHREPHNKNIILDNVNSRRTHIFKK